MSDDRRTRLRFSLSTLLLLVAIFGLTVALIISQIRISRLEAEAATGRPLSYEEVAGQFEQQTSVGGVTVKVTDARYSPKEDVYQVSFSWSTRNPSRTGAQRSSSRPTVLGGTTARLKAIRTSKASEYRPQTNFLSSWKRHHRSNSNTAILDLFFEVVITADTRLSIGTFDPSSFFHPWITSSRSSRALPEK